ncbi:hypothetical protein Musp01_01240 [Muricauda sp. NBRC 101325]|nr:hypothetical protein Musp01_01240 [Muricauda sp. NBRC 101325]
MRLLQVLFSKNKVFKTISNVNLTLINCNLNVINLILHPKIIGHERKNKHLEKKSGREVQPPMALCQGLC